MKKKLLVLLCVCNVMFIFAQNNNRSNIRKVDIIGTVYNVNDKEPIPFATVAIYSEKDTALISGATTELNGSFTIPNISIGKYFLVASFVGFTTYSKSIDVIGSQRKFDVGKLELQQGIELSTFEIRETYIPVKTVDDTIIFAAEAFRAPEGSALEELLKRFPGAEVDKDGKITINGKEISKILVNGKKFFDDDPKIAAKNLPANIVDKVQVFDKSSDQAQFSGIDDGESEQVINLIIKPGMQKGVFGNITAAGGSNAPTMNENFNFNDDFRYSNKISLNYFRDDDQLSIIGSLNNCNDVGFTDMMGSSGAMNIMGGRGSRGGYSSVNSAGINKSASLGINFSKSFSPKFLAGGDYQFGHSNNNSEGNLTREEYLTTGNTLFHENNHIDKISQQHTLRFEFEYKPNDKNTINIRPNVRYATSNESEINDGSLSTIENEILNRTSEINSTNSYSLNSNMEVSWRHKFSKPRRTIWLSAEGGIRNGQGRSNNYTTTSYETALADTVDQEIKNYSGRYNFAIRAGYTEPLTKNTSLEIRYNFSQTVEDRDKETYNISNIGNVLDSNLSSFYGNRFLEHRIETRVQWNYSKLNFGLGLGLYPSVSENIIFGGESISRSVLNYAPNAQLTYRPSKQESMRLFYRGRASQPSMTQLQPVPDMTNPTTVKLGNLDLAPSFNHGLRMMYNKFFPATTASIFGMFMGNLNQNTIANVTITDPSLYPELNLANLPKGSKYTRYANVDYTYNAMLNFTASTPIARTKFVVSFSTNDMLTNSKSIINKEINNSDNYTTNNTLKLTYRLLNFDFSVNTKFIISKATYSLQPNNNITYNTLSGGADFNWTIIPNLILSSDFSYNKTNGYYSGYNPITMLWNAQVSWSLGKHNEFILRVRAMDMLNNNVNVVRNVTSTYVEDVSYNALGRYILIGLTYNINATKAKEEADKQMEQIRSGELPRRGGGMRSPM